MALRPNLKTSIILKDPVVNTNVCDLFKLENSCQYIFIVYPWPVKTPYFDVSPISAMQYDPEFSHKKLLPCISQFVQNVHNVSLYIIVYIFMLLYHIIPNIFFSWHCFVEFDQSYKEEQNHKHRHVVAINSLLVGWSWLRSD